MFVSDYPTQNIHLPPHRATLRTIRFISLSSLIVIMLIAITLLVDFLLKLHIMTALFDKSLSNLPTVIALLANSSAAYLYTKDNKSQFMGVRLLTLLFFLGLISGVIGGFTLLDLALPHLAIVPYFSAVNGKAGLIFLIVGLSI